MKSVSYPSGAWNAWANYVWRNPTIPNNGQGLFRNFLVSLLAFLNQGHLKKLWKIQERSPILEVSNTSPQGWTQPWGQTASCSMLHV